MNSRKEADPRSLRAAMQDFTWEGLTAEGVLDANRADEHARLEAVKSIGAAARLIDERKCQYVYLARAGQNDPRKIDYIAINPGPKINVGEDDDELVVAMVRVESAGWNYPARSGKAGLALIMKLSEDLYAEVYRMDGSDTITNRDGQELRQAEDLMAFKEQLDKYVATHLEEEAKKQKGATTATGEETVAEGPMLGGYPLFHIVRESAPATSA